jgi:hypothetical protein
MEIDLKELIEDVITKFSRNRTGPKPRVLAKISPDLPLISSLLDSTKAPRAWLRHE